MKRCFWVIASCCILYSQQTLAWGHKGHALVAEVAFSLLDSARQQKIKSYISDMSIEQAAGWMDDVRSDHKYDYMKSWHYVNINKGASYAANNEDNVVNALIKASAELEHRDKLSDAQIRLDILTIMHLVGDIHQPLHVGYGDDKGGNTVEVTYNGHGTNLHKTWDSEIIDHENITLSDCMRRLHKLDKDDVAMLSSTNIESWVRQGRSQLNGVYDFKDGTIDDAYSQKNKTIIEDDIVIAGIRLAALLKKIF